MDAVDSVYGQLVDAGVNLICGVADSLLAPLHRHAAARPEIDYLPVCDEATAVAVAAGSRLAGARSLVLMENSGLRRACETLCRLTLGHRLHMLLLIARRGAFGEPNWWGIAHEETMFPHLRMLPMAVRELDSTAEFGTALQQGLATLETGQRSVTLIANPGFLAGLAETS